MKIKKHSLLLLMTLVTTTCGILSLSNQSFQEVKANSPLPYKSHAIGDIINRVENIDYSYTYLIKSNEYYLRIKGDYTVSSTTEKSLATPITFEHYTKSLKYVVYDGHYMSLESTFTPITFKNEKSLSCAIELSNNGSFIDLKSITSLLYLKHLYHSDFIATNNDMYDGVVFEVYNKPIIIDKTSLITKVNSEEILTVKINTEDAVNWTIQSGATASELTIVGNNEQCIINTGSIPGEARINAIYGEAVESCLVIVRDPQADAEIFALSFKFYLGCDPDGIDPVYESKWEFIRESLYSPLTNDAKQILDETSADQNGSSIEQCVFIHDLCVKKYGFNIMFLGRAASLNTPNIFNNIDNTTTIITISILLGLSTTSFLLYFLFKNKRK